MPSVVTDDAAAGSASATEPRAGLVDDVKDELQWTFTGRKGWLLGMVFNLVVAIVVTGYERYDPHVQGEIKIANIGVAIVIYVLAGTLATNQLGADAERVVNSLERGDRVSRILSLKNIALAVLMVPVALLVSVIVRVLVDRWRLLPHTAMYDIGAVFVWLGLGNLVSVTLPYRPISLRARLKARPTWIRWAVRQAIPYALFYLGAPCSCCCPRRRVNTSRYSARRARSTTRCCFSPIRWWRGSSVCGSQQSGPAATDRGSWPSSAVRIEGIWPSGAPSSDPRQLRDQARAIDRAALAVEALRIQRTEVVGALDLLR
jgi:hypothetical protein